MKNHCNRIAVIATGFGDSTLPLVKTLCDYGFKVDCYFLAFGKKGGKIQSGYDQRSFYLPGFYKLTPNNTNGIDFIKKYKWLRIYYCQLFPTGESHSGKIWNILSFFPRMICKSFFLYIKMKQYDFIDCISQRDFYNFLNDMVKAPFVISTHEVFNNHLEGDKDFVPSVSKVIDSGGFLRVFSKSSYEELLHRTIVEPQRLFLVPFGFFDTYSSFKEETLPELLGWDNYILYIGFISPYKGLDNLYRAIRPLIDDAQLVVAGYGSHQSLKQFRELKNTIVINRWIKNGEFVNLIRKCKFIVCPYISASQSGLPQTAFVFGKPIIASSVGAFPEIITNGVTGYLYNPTDIDTLCDCISTLIYNDKIYNDMVKNIKNKKGVLINYSWRTIIKQYIQMIEIVVSSKKSQTT